MILTAKAKEDFYYWYWNVWFEDKERDYYKSKEEALHALNYTDVVFMNAILIEWFDSIGLWEQEFYNVYIESTPTTEFKQIVNRTIINLNRKYNTDKV